MPSTTTIAEHHLRHRSLGRVLMSVHQDKSDVAVALRYGSMAEEPVPVRIQSACLYGETLGAVDCDCRAQLDLSYEIFRQERRGLLIHLNQEGRGAGLAIKARAYALQESDGLDTVAAYQHMNIEVDKRDYTIAAALLRLFGIRRVDLLTNNWRKENQLTKLDISVTRRELLAAVTTDNICYLRAKQEKLGHLLGLVESREYDIVMP